MTDTVSSVCSPDLPCCWRQTRDRFSPKEAEPEKWILILWVRIVAWLNPWGVIWSTIQAGQDWHGQKSVCQVVSLLSACLVMDGLQSLLGTSSGAQDFMGASGQSLCLLEWTSIICVGGQTNDYKKMQIDRRGTQKDYNCKETQNVQSNTETQRLSQLQIVRTTIEM